MRKIAKTVALLTLALAYYFTIKPQLTKIIDDLDGNRDNIEDTLSSYQIHLSYCHIRQDLTPCNSVADQFRPNCFQRQQIKAYIWASKITAKAIDQKYKKLGRGDNVVKCRHLAILGTLFLSKRNIPVKLNCGPQKLPSGEPAFAKNLSKHTWLSIGKQTIWCRDNPDNYFLLQSFMKTHNKSKNL